MIGGHNMSATAALSRPSICSRPTVWSMPRASYTPSETSSRAISRIMKSGLLVELERWAATGIPREAAVKISQEARLHAYAAHDLYF